MKMKKVKLHADDACIKHLPFDITVPAKDDDFDTEFLCLEMAVKSVDSMDCAIDHINSHGSHHTDCIITENRASAEKFLISVDSAGVFHNASTRFADGFRYGFGAEVGVSTHRIHARGPVGVEGLMIYKYRLYGSGHIVGDYGVGEGKKSYKHRDIPSPTLPAL
jgi:glutamate-5-semialdehyde dehydrogenase